MSATTTNKATTASQARTGYGTYTETRTSIESKNTSKSKKATVNKNASKSKKTYKRESKPKCYPQESENSDVKNTLGDEADHRRSAGKVIPLNTQVASENTKQGTQCRPVDKQPTRGRELWKKCQRSIKKSEKAEKTKYEGQPQKQKGRELWRKVRKTWKKKPIQKTESPSDDAESPDRIQGSKEKVQGRVSGSGSLMMDCLLPSSSSSYLVVDERRSSNSSCDSREFSPDQKSRSSVKNKLKNTSSKLNRKMNNWKEKLMMFADSSHQYRTIRIVYGDDDGSEREEEEEYTDCPSFNYTTSMLMTELKNGCFTAKIPLDVLPSGDITLRVRNYRMEIIVGKRTNKIDDKHRITNLIKYGDIDIPIYINPQSLQFKVKDKILQIAGYTKGSLMYGRSASFGHLSDPKLSVKTAATPGVSNNKAKVSVKKCASDTSLAELSSYFSSTSCVYSMT